MLKTGEFDEISVGYGIFGRGVWEMVVVVGKSGVLLRDGRSYRTFPNYLKQLAKLLGYHSIVQLNHYSLDIKAKTLSPDILASTQTDISSSCPLECFHQDRSSKAEYISPVPGQFSKVS